MLNIQKIPEPPSLTARRSNVINVNGAVGLNAYQHTSTAIKNDIRAGLVREQGGLCCYCMSRIGGTVTRIEHWLARSTHPQRQLDYDIMLGACHGNQDATDPDDERRCDVCRGNSSLKFNPANPAHDVEALIRYEGDGKLIASDADFDNQVNQVLNLNYAKLRNRRAAVVSAVAAVAQGDKAHTSGLLLAWRSRNASGELTEFCGVAIYLLKVRLSGMN